MLSCRNCGAPYTGGIICEKCGTRYTEEELRSYDKTGYPEKELQDSSAKNNHSGSSGDNPAFIIAIIFAVVSGLVIIPVLIAIFVPAIIGYNAKKQAAEERQAAVVQEIEDSVIPIEKESSYCDLSDSDSVKVELSEGEYIKLKFGGLEKAE